MIYTGQLPTDIHGGRGAGGGGVEGWGGAGGGEEGKEELTPVASAYKHG